MTDKDLSKISKVIKLEITNKFASLDSKLDRLMIAVERLSKKIDTINSLAISTHPSKIMKEVDFEFEDFIFRPLDEVRADFEKTGKYSKEFVDSLMKGLARSSIYADKKN